MIQYIFENVFSFGIGAIFLISTLIIALLFLFRSTKRSGIERYLTLAFGFSLLFFSAAHGVWIYRVAFFPTHPGLSVIFPYWQGFWILFMIGVTFIGVWSLLLSYAKWFETRKWITILLFVPWIIVTLDVLLIANPSLNEWVCTALISDLRPDFLVILVVGLSLTFFVGLAVDYYYQQSKSQEEKFVPFLTLLGLFLILFGGILETRVIPVCQVITLGRILMLIGLWVTAYGILTLPLIEAAEVS